MRPPFPLPPTPAAPLRAAEEQDKVRFVHDLAAHWAGLDAARARIRRRCAVAVRTAALSGCLAFMPGGPAAAHATAPAFAPRLAPPGGLELHRSPAMAGRRPVTAWNAMIDDRRAYVLLGPLDAPIAEGVGHAPPGALAGAEAAAARRHRQYAFTALAPRVRVHLSYGVQAGEARAWVWTSGRDGDRLHFAGRAPRTELPTLVEWAFDRELRPLVEGLAHAAGTPAARRAAMALPRLYFR